MRRPCVAVLVLVFLAQVGCADQPLQPDVDLAVTEKKPPLPPVPPDPAELAKPEISYAAGCGGNNCLWVVDADGDNATAVYTASYMVHSSWSDQGQGTLEEPYVILVSQSGAAAQTLDRLEVVVDGDGPRVQAITTLSTDTYHHAVVRPGGQEFAAIGSDELWRRRVLIGDMSTGDMTPIYTVEGERALWQPAWNADGTKLVFFEGESDAPRWVDVRIIDMELDPGDEGWMKTALSFIWEGWSPQNLSWGRTSNQLLLDLEVLVYAVDLDSPNPALGDPITEGRMASWDPDDSRFIYQDSGRLFIHTLGGGKAKRLPKGARPDWRR
jgi:hypothetical protein